VKCPSFLDTRPKRYRYNSSIPHGLVLEMTVLGVESVKYPSFLDTRPKGYRYNSSIPYGLVLEMTVLERLMQGLVVTQFNIDCPLVMQCKNDCPPRGHFEEGVKPCVTLNLFTIALSRNTRGKGSVKCPSFLDTRPKRYRYNSSIPHGLVLEMTVLGETSPVVTSRRASSQSHLHSNSFHSLYLFH
jgi:hypothetical protein